HEAPRREGKVQPLGDERRPGPDEQHAEHEQDGSHAADRTCRKPLAVAAATAQYSARRVAPCGATTHSLPLPSASNRRSRGSGTRPGRRRATSHDAVTTVGRGPYVTYTDQVITCSDCGID